MEREIRHKIKKGDLSEIPKDVLDSMTPSLLAPPKGLLKCCYFFKVLSTVYLMMLLSQRQLSFFFMYVMKTILNAI